MSEIARILANVQNALDESTQAGEAEFEKEREQQAAKVEARGELEEIAKLATSLVSLAAKPGVPTKKCLSAMTGAKASSFEIVGPREAAAIRAAAAIVK